VGKVARPKGNVATLPFPQPRTDYNRHRMFGTERDWSLAFASRPDACMHLLTWKFRPFWRFAADYCKYGCWFDPPSRPDSLRWRDLKWWPISKPEILGTITDQAGGQVASQQPPLPEKFFVLCFHHSATFPSWKIATRDHEVRAFPTDFFQRGLLKYQLYLHEDLNFEFKNDKTGFYSPEAAALLGGVAEGENTLPGIVSRLASGGFTLLCP